MVSKPLGKDIDSDGSEVCFDEEPKKVLNVTGQISL